MTNWPLPNRWAWGRLVDIAANIPNAIVDGPFGSNLKTSDYVEHGMPVLQGKNITNDEFNWTEVRFISEQKAYELRRSSVRPKDFLIVKIGSIGYCAQIPHLNGYEFAIIPANLAKITLNESVIYSGYFSHWMRTIEAKRYFDSVASKTAQPALSLSKIKEAPIPLPPLAEQKRIAAILDQADVLRKARRRAIERLNDLSQSIFYEMFGDPKLNQKGLPKESLGNLIKVKSGEALISSVQDASGSIPVYGGNGITGYHNQYLFDEPKLVIGRVGVYCGSIYKTEPCSWITDNALYIIKIPENLNIDYLEAALRLANLNQYAGRSSQPLVSGSRIYPVEILVPSLERQLLFSQCLAGLKQSLNSYRHSQEKLSNLFSSLQKRAFRGELSGVRETAQL